VNKFKSMVNAIGTQTLQAIAIAGPDLQVRMLQALGLKSTLITDGSNPINLLETAQGLIGGLQPYKKQKIDE
jgi:major vault protein